MWWPPSESRCEALEEQPGVRLLSPPDLREVLSYPYELHWIADRRMLVTSFKSAANLTLGALERERSNQVLFFDLADPDRPRITRHVYSDSALPQHFLRLRDPDELVVTRLGYEQSHVDVFDLEATSGPRRVRSAPVRGQPHQPVAHPDPGSFVLTTTSRFVEVLDRELLTRRSTFRMRTGPPWGGLIVLNGTQAADPSIFYVSLLGTRIGRAHVRSGVHDTLPVGFGAGGIEIDPAGTVLVQTDALLDHVNVIDPVEWRLDRRVPLGFTPRGLALDVARDRLYVGEWFPGRVHVLGLSGLEPIGEPVEVGPYLRALALDPEGRRLYAGSKCGVTQITLGGGGSTAPGGPAKP